MGEAGKKGRKIGGNKKSPSHMRYTQQQRWIKNKEKKKARNLRQQKRNMEHAEQNRTR